MDPPKSTPDDETVRQPDENLFQPTVAPMTSSENSSKVPADSSTSPITQQVTETPTIMTPVSKPDQPSTSQLNTPQAIPTIPPTSPPLPYNDNSQTEQVALSQAKRSKAMLTLHQHESSMAIVLIVIVVLLAIFNVYFTLHVLHVRKVAYANLPSTQSKIAIAKFGPMVEKRSNATLDLSNLVNPSLVAQNQNMKAGLNEQVNFADGNSLMITSIEPNWQDTTDSYIAPQPGQYFILLNEVIGNRSKYPQTPFIVGLGTGLLNGQILQNIDMGMSVTFNNPNTSNCDTLSLDSFFPGEQKTCSDVIQVPKGSLPKLVYSEKNYAIGGQPLIMKATITL